MSAAEPGLDLLDDLLDAMTEAIDFHTTPGRGRGGPFVAAEAVLDLLIERGWSAS